MGYIGDFNLIALFLLSNVVVKLTKEYFETEGKEK